MPEMKMDCFCSEWNKDGSFVRVNIGPYSLQVPGHIFSLSTVCHLRPLFSLMQFFSPQKISTAPAVGRMRSWLI